MSRVLPIACWPLSSTSATRRDRRWCAANITASQTEPSLHSASLRRTKTRRADPSSRAASAAPAPKERPSPREPVVRSTPGRTRSGWTPSREPSAQNVSSSAGATHPRRERAPYRARAACPFERMKRSRSGSAGDGILRTRQYSTARASATDRAEPMCPTLARRDCRSTTRRISRAAWTTSLITCFRRRERGLPLNARTVYRGAAEDHARYRWRHMRRGLWIGLFVLALAVRLVGLDFDQGHFYHPDERAIGDAILKISFRPLQLNPHFFAYGSFPLYVTKAVSSTLAAVTGRPWLASYDGVIHVGRFLSALWGALTVLLLALLGRRWYGEKAGLLAGLLLALAVLHVQTSHFAATDVALTFLVLLALACASRLANRGRPRDAVLAGAVTRLALATKASAAPLLLPLAVAVFLATKDRRAFGRAAVLLAAAGAAALVAFAVGEPYAFLDARAFWRSVTEQGTMVRHAGIFPYTNQYVGVPDFLYEGKELVLWGLGPLLGLTALWATLVRLARVRALGAREWVLASFLVPYVLITCTFEVKFPRYLLPVYPILMLWAGAWLTEKAERGRAGRVLRAAVVGGTAV